MSKFKVGDEVVCIDASGSDLDMLQYYTVTEVDNGGNIALNNEEWFYFGARFELFSEWAAHQKPVNTETELALTKLQVKMLQDWKKDALYLLRKTSHEDMIPTTLREEIDYFLVNNKLEGFDE